MTDEITRLMRLVEFSDSAFPVGTFSFSNGLESAAFEGLVHDAATLSNIPVRCSGKRFIVMPLLPCMLFGQRTEMTMGR